MMRLKDLLGEIIKRQNEQKPKLLWTNPNDSSAFEPQIINIDLSPYAFIDIDFEWGTTNKNHIVQRFLIGGNYVGRLNASYGANSKVLCCYRSFDFTKSTIKFADAWVSTSSSDAKNNSAAIPLRIYGIRK